MEKRLIDGDMDKRLIDGDMEKRLIDGEIKRRGNRKMKRGIDIDMERLRDRD
jgi:hypothetical protein